ncbi:MAG: hypothetical protein ACLTZG_14495 [Hungatella hathewayi]|uniref:hypothetical protein n=2 Tax=Lachnospirales TaxID=3085636 RepID=UPI0026735DDC|nr:hypothetical protein [Hungatella hathewayi]
MSLDELALILCDMYEMDEWLPNPVFDKKEFTRVSNTLWAIGEFRNYVADHIFPQTKMSIKNLEAMARSFIEKMDDFASMNQQNSSIFTTAKMVGENIQDLLYAMESQAAHFYDNEILGYQAQSYRGKSSKKEWWYVAASKNCPDTGRRGPSTISLKNLC